MDPPVCMNGHLMIEDHGTGGVRVCGEWWCPECGGCDCYWCQDIQSGESADGSYEQNGKQIIL